MALDPALPLAVRLQLINSRRDLRSKVGVSGSESRLDDSYLWQKNGMDFFGGYPNLSSSNIEQMYNI